MLENIKMLLGINPLDTDLDNRFKSKSNDVIVNDTGY